MKMNYLKAWRDISFSLKRTVLVVFALVLGLFGVGSVVVSYVILTNDLNANFQSTSPQHVIFKSDDFSLLNLPEFRNNPDVEAAEFRDFSLHRIEIKPNVWIPLWLYGVENINEMKVARIFQEQGKKESPSGTVWMERDGLKISEIVKNSMPQVRIRDKNSTLQVSEICFDPGQAPATQDAFIYAYTDQKSYNQITGLPINQRLIVRLNHVKSAEEVKLISQKLEAQFKASGIEIKSVEFPKFNEHPHQWQLNTLLFLIGTIGLLAFVMAAVLVSQLMKAILAGQIKQIGIMKTLGASRFRIVQIYLTMLLIMGAAAGFFAIPLSIISGKAFSAFVAKTLNFNILTTSVPPLVIIGLILASLILPVLLSAATILKATGTSIRLAITDNGVSSTTTGKKFGFSRKLPLQTIPAMAVRNSLRNYNRLLVTVFAMAFGVAIFSTGFNVRQSLWELLSGVKNELRYDVQVVLNQTISKEEAIKPFNNLMNVKQVEMWVGGRGEIQSKVKSTGNGTGIVALPYQSPLLKLKMIEGRWINASSEIEIVLNQQAWNLYKNPSLGSVIDLNYAQKNIKVKVVGIAEQFEKPKLYIDLVKYDSLFNQTHEINTLNFVAENNSFDQVVQLKKNIENKISPSGLNVLYVMSQAERVKIIHDHLNIILSTIVVLSFLVLIVSAVGMASATGINILERTREIGVMRAIGATPNQIFKLFVYEGMMVSLVSICFGLILSYPLSQLASVFFGNLLLGEGAKLTYAFSPLGFWVTLLTTLIFGWLASRIPAKTAITVSTREALSYE